MFNICKCLKCKKKKSKMPKINIETNKIASYVQKEYGLRVYLNVYHLTFFNYILQFFGFGLFHLYCLYHKVYCLNKFFLLRIFFRILL